MSDGSVAIRSRTYDLPAADDRHRSDENYEMIAEAARRIGSSGAPLLVRLDSLTSRLSSHPATPADLADLRRTVFDLSANLVHPLLELASLHEEEWMRIIVVAEEPPPSNYDPEDDDDDEAEEEERERRRSLTRAGDEFDGSANAYEAALDVYGKMRAAVSPPDDDENGRPLLASASRATFSPSDREAIAAGRSAVHLRLADLHRSRYNSMPDDESAADDDCSIAYGHLMRSESLAEDSLRLLGVDLERESGDGEDGAEGARGRRRSSSRSDGMHRDAERSMAEAEARRTMAAVRMRIGALLVDMYATGYVLDAGGNLRRVPPEVIEAEDRMPNDGGGRRELGEDDVRILELALDKMRAGSAIYDALSRDEEGGEDAGIDYGLSVADSAHYAGMALSHLLRWDEAARELERSAEIYDDLFDAYSRAGMREDAMAISSGMIQTTQGLFEAYSNLHGKTEPAKEAFRKHLALRRYSELQVPIDRPFSDEDDASGYDRLEFGTHQTPHGGSVVDSHYDEEIKTYRATLEEYLRSKDDYGRDGSYYDMEFDWDGAGYASYVQHDSVYEGSLRSGMGSLQLAQNRLREAEGELSLATGLLRDGLDGDGGRDHFEAYGEDGEIMEYSVRLELANALLNLAYARLGLGMWGSSYEAYEEAMDLYASELPEGETPMAHSGGSKGGGGEVGWGEMLGRFFRETIGVEGDDAKDEHVGADDRDVVENNTYTYMNMDHIDL